eukprot:TRINITY_DN728_c0_g1_i3.p1 TRINITY_DN728_c0_g1~~TRINITY_DN728_c0_g1_i3.p1  ORF type:complete len:851 (-),score=164.34 TRINITY_DN728_c0_g1_i3:1418-3970(-)
MFSFEESGTDVREYRSTSSNSRLKLYGLILSCTIAILSVLIVTIFVQAKVGPIKVEYPRKKHVNYPDMCNIKNSEAVEYPEHIPFCINNAQILIGDGQLLTGSTITVENGIIKSIGTTCPESFHIVNAHNAYITPGLVDMHSHAGVHGLPSTKGDNDVNDYGHGDTIPQGRVVDSYDPNDRGIIHILQGGVTTSQILPGSGNAVGGRGLQVKMRGITVEKARIKNAPITLKMACGENPKRNYGMTRMGTTWDMRRMFEQSQIIMRQQDEWCNMTDGDRSVPMPNSLEYDNIIQLLRNNAVLNVHCYKVTDMEMMIRLSKEFDFSIGSFHHALEAYKMPQILYENDIAIATFSDHSNYKMEAFHHSVYQARILEENNVNVVIKTDHPVTSSSRLLYSAQRAWHYGLSSKQTIASVTINPSNAMGLSHRLGIIKEGFDADIVLWDRNPLLLGARPIKVWIEGELLVEQDYEIRNNRVVDIPDPSKMVLEETLCNLEKTPSSFRIIGAKIIHTFDSSDTISEGNIIIENGLVTCVGDCPSAIDRVIDLKGGIIVPGFIHVGHLGLIEVSQESNMVDGYLNGDSKSHVVAIDGIKPNINQVRAAWASGITTAIVSPRSSGVHSGYSSSFNTGGILLTEDTIIEKKMSYNLNAGMSFKTKAVPTLSSQIYQIRKFINTTPPNTTISIRANSADVMLSLLRILKGSNNSIHLIIIGAAEVNLIIDELKLFKNYISIILEPAHCPRKQPEQYRCDESAIAKLIDAGINVGITEIENAMAHRNLRWEAGILTNYIDNHTAIRLITKNIADMYNLQNQGTIEIGKPPNLVAFTDDPLSLKSTIELVIHNSNIECRPRQT